MRRDGRPPGLTGLIWAGLRRSWWQAAVGLFAGLVAAAALVASLSLFQAMARLLDSGLAQLGADVVLCLPDDRQLVERWLSTGSTGPIEPQIDAAAWRSLVEEAEILGLSRVEAVDLTRGGAGEPAGPRASLLVLRLEFWGNAMMAKMLVEESIPGVEVVVGEQATRHVLTDLQPLVRHLTRGAGVAVLGAVLISGLLTSIRIGQRRAELGMLRAMGATRSYIVRLTLGESAAVALVGGLAGSLLATALLWSLPVTAQILRYLPPVHWLGLVAVATAGLAAASALAALGPALQAARLDPLEAIRRHR